MFQNQCQIQQSVKKKFSQRKKQFKREISPAYFFAQFVRANNLIKIDFFLSLLADFLRWKIGPMAI